MRHGLRHRLDQRIHLLPVFERPSEKRMLERARSAVSPIASSTCEGSTAPLEHAEPLDTAKPRRSSAITSASPSIPSKWMLVVFGVRAARAAVDARVRAPAPESPFSSRSRSRPAARLCRQTVRPPAPPPQPNAAAPGTFSVPGRRSRS